MTISAAAKQLKVSYQCVWQMIQTGRLKGRRGPEGWQVSLARYKPRQRGRPALIPASNRLSVSQVARVLDIKNVVILAWIHRGHIEAVRTVGGWEIPKGEIKKLRQRRAGRPRKSARGLKGPVTMGFCVMCPDCKTSFWIRSIEPCKLVTCPYCHVVSNRVQLISGQN